jgi:hypothetical protein
MLGGMAFWIIIHIADRQGGQVPAEALASKGVMSKWLDKAMKKRR